MKRFSIPQLVLACAMALLLPLEQLHCTCLGSLTAPAPVTAHAAHSCCAARSSGGTAHHAQHPQGPRACACVAMIPVLVPAAVAAGPEARTATPLAALAVPTVIAPVSIHTETVPALDVGSPPLPDDPGAHGLRAPPLFA